MPTDTVRIASMSIPEALGASLLGFAIVFFVLIALMVMIGLMRLVLESMDSGNAPATAGIPVAAPVAAAAMIPAKGSLGEINLHDVDDRTAAMIMAIVANEMGAPLNELRFLSIRGKK